MKTANPSKIRVERVENGRALRITLDAGRGNVLDSRAITELREVALTEGTARTLCAIVIDHEGPDFCFGASVPEHELGQVEAMLPAFHSLARELLALHVPIVVAVKGRCLGGGLELALLADRIIAAPDAKFAQPEIQLGVFAPLGSILLPRVVGARLATELLITGRTVGAEEALAIGLVAEVSADPSAEAYAWVREHLLPRSAEALHHATRAARGNWLGTFETELAERERQYLVDLMASADAREGIRAFLEKRTPTWRDR